MGRVAGGGVINTTPRLTGTSRIRTTGTRVPGPFSEEDPQPPPEGEPAQYTRLTTISNYPVGNDASLGGLWHQQEYSADRAAIVSLSGESVIRTRAVVGETGVAGAGLGERCELMVGPGSTYWNNGTLRFVPGDEFVLGTMFWLDSTFKSSGFLYGTDHFAFNNFVQTHHGWATGQVPFQLNLCTDDARLGMRLIGGGSATGPYNSPDGTPEGSQQQWWWTLAGPPNRYEDNVLVGGAGVGGNDAANYEVPKGEWLSLIINVRFHTSGGGHAKVWINGTQRFNATNVSIGYNNEPGAYLKFGMYRNGSDLGTAATGDGIIYWRD